MARGNFARGGVQGQDHTAKGRLGEASGPGPMARSDLGWGEFRPRWGKGSGSGPAQSEENLAVRGSVPGPAWLEEVLA